jgi:hypothetical protein
VGQTFEVVPRDAEVPEGSALATVEEANRHKASISPLLAEFSIVALEGGKIDGVGYGNNVSDKEPGDDCTKKLLIVKQYQIQESPIKQKKNLRFEMTKQNMNVLLFKDSPFIYIIRLLTQNYGIHIKLTANLSEKICQGTLKCLKAMSTYFEIWSKFGEKLEMGDINAKLEDSHKVGETLEYNLTEVYQHMSYYLGHLAYNYVKIEPVAEAPKATSDDPEKQKALDKEHEKKAILKLVIQSNLISGGMEERHLSSLSDPTKEKMLGLAGMIQDSKLIEALMGSGEETLDALDDEVLSAIIQDGQCEETDYLIGLLQRLLETRVPPISFARLGGINGLKISRAAFAVMLKYSDVLEDFVALRDEVAAQANLESSETDKQKNLMAFIKTVPHSDVILRRWESASRMRQWINEKKQTLANELESSIK